MSPIIVWFRRDLRLADNPALSAAATSGRPVIPLYIHDDGGCWRPGAASRFWLHQSLARLDADLRALGSRLVLGRGAALDVLRAMSAASGAGAVYWNRRYEPQGIAVDRAVKAALGPDLDVASFNGALLFEPWTIATAAGHPYRVFTPYYRACRRIAEVRPALPVPAAVRAPSAWPAGVALETLALEPRIDWAAGIRERWRFGERAAQSRAERFLESAVRAYRDARDFPAREGVSGLSPHLHFGEISAVSLWHAAAAAAAADASEEAVEAWLRQLVWREFAYHLLYHFPHTTDAPLREEFDRMRWIDDRDGLRCWQQGRTGFPLVDAGMRELWHTGYMHNRVRMVVASFLTKHLGVHWLEGGRWFWDTLVDADLANNTFGWQWTAGCGADAAPYHRIFNPESQARRFDPAGDYIRRWVPELAAVPAPAVHTPGARAPGYPAPIIDLAAARAAALARFREMRS